MDWSFVKFKKDKQRRPVSGWTVYVRPSITFENGNYRLNETPQSQTVRRNYVLPQLRVSLIRQILNGVNYFSLNAKYNTYSPSLTNLVDKTFTYDPLNVIVGNPELKKRGNLGFDFSFGVGSECTQQLNVTFEWSKDYDAIGSKYIYDKSTGVKTSQMVNVDGNWDGGVNVRYWRWLDRKQRFMFNLGGYVQYLNYENYVGTSFSEPPVKTGTRKLIVYETASLDYRYKKVKAGLVCTVDYNHITSSRSDFNNLSTTALHYGANTTIELPWGMQLSTDLTMFSRYGYESASMNRNDLVWNARLSKRFMHKKLTLMIDAWDLLGNLSNVDAGNNATRRWEYYTNVIPRYVMARLVFKFAKQPKKK